MTPNKKQVEDMKQGYADTIKIEGHRILDLIQTLEHAVYIINRTRIKSTGFIHGPSNEIHEETSEFMKEWEK